MDERKGLVRTLLKYSVFGSLGLFILVSAYAGYVFWKTQAIENPKKCFTTKMYKVHLCPSNPQYIHFKQVPKHFFQALILSEDASFYSHKGFDWFEIKESFRRNFVEWRFARGGSTLTQQLAKNLYLNKSKSLDRKFKEFFIARQIEKKLSKSQILEKYINVVEFGKNLYGLKSAAQNYFGKDPGSLNILESIYLVSLLPSPVRLGRSLQQRKLSKNNLWRMKIIMKRMYRTGKINDELFVYLKMLLEDAEWPFDHYSDGMFDPSSIEDQLFEEFEELEDSDSYFEESDKSSEENVTDEDVQLEPKKSEAGEDAEPEEITPDAGEQKRDESFMSSKPEDEEESEASGDEIEVIEAPPLENQSKDGNTVIEFEDTP